MEFNVNPVCVCACACVSACGGGVALGIMKPAGKDEPQTHSCTQAQAKQNSWFKFTSATTIRYKQFKSECEQHMCTTTHSLQCKQVFVCTFSCACQLRNETKQLWGLRHPLCSATYCLRSRVCILYSKLGRAKPCGKCALENTKSHTLPWKLPHTEPDRLGIDNIPFCFSIYSGKI